MSAPLVEFVDGKIRLACTREGCHYTKVLEEATASFQRHLDQHVSPRVPDIFMTVTYEGRCSACGRGFRCEVDDSELVWCQHCLASWDIYGGGGRTDRVPEYEEGEEGK